MALTRERGEIVYGEMEQPIPSPEPFEHVDELLAAVGVKRSELPVEAYRQGPTHVYVMLSSEAEVAALEPNFDALSRLGAIGANCFRRRGRRFKTRMFGIGMGVSEDPATGRPRVRSRCISRDTAGSRMAPASRSARGRRFTGLRSSTRRSTGARTGWSAWRSGGSAVIVASGEFRLT